MSTVPYPVGLTYPQLVYTHLVLWGLTALLSASHAHSRALARLLAHAVLAWHFFLLAQEPTVSEEQYKTPLALSLDLPRPANWWWFGRETLVGKLGRVACVLGAGGNAWGVLVALVNLHLNWC